jgi:hypothetical protein
MSHDAEETSIAELELQAGEARSRLKSDIEALAHLVSPEHLKQEAIEAAADVAHSAQVALTRWSGQAKVVAQEYWLPGTLTLGFGAFLYAAASRRKVPFLLSALACGAGAWSLASRTHRKRSSLPELHGGHRAAGTVQHR